MSHTVAFALVVVQHPDNDKFCLVHEKQDRGWWLPGGGVDAGQTFEEAAVREAMEEAGVDCFLTGVLRVECTNPKCGRMRVIFHARPRDANVPLKSIADHHSKGARWVTIAQMRDIAEGKAIGGVDPATCKLRGDEPKTWFTYLANGGRVHSLSMLEMIRLGQVAEWAGPGEPPRAVYRTSFSIAITGTNGDTVAVDEFNNLPQLKNIEERVNKKDVRATLNGIAKSLALQWGLGEVTGVMRVRHVLDLRSSEESNHCCTLEVQYAAASDPEDATAAGKLSNYKWESCRTACKRVVIAHNNIELRAAAEAWQHNGWQVRILDKGDVPEVLQTLNQFPGAPLICTSEFPLEKIPLTSRPLVWSQSAAADSSLKARLFAKGVAYVASTEDLKASNYEGLLVAVEGAMFPNLLHPEQPLDVIGTEQ